MSASEDRYDAALRFLLGRIDYERMPTVPYRGADFKLSRMVELLDRLGNPHERLAILHVAGTKGKGSTVAMLSAVLTAAGYRTGMFTSPHFEKVEERFRIDGSPCSAAELTGLIEAVRPAVDAMDRVTVAEGPTGPTYFEITTAMALLHFVQRKVDAAILEVGLGGRLDSTNVCTPRVSLITSISLDHTQQLGNTLGAIAREKAGIVKPGVPVVSGALAAEARAVIAEVCRTHRSRLVELGVDFAYDYRPPRNLQQAASTGRMDFRPLRSLPGAVAQAPYHDLALNLPGRHQAANASLALAALDELRREGWQIDESSVRRGLAAMCWPGRAEVVHRRPAVVVDVAHNPASIEALVETLTESFCAKRRHLIFAASKEKDIRGMLERLLRHFDNMVFTRYQSNPRSVAPEQLAKLAQELAQRHFLVAETPALAVASVREAAQPDDLICATGSFFIAAEVRRLFGE